MSQHASLVKPSVIVPGQEGVQRCMAHASKDGGYSPECEGNFPDLCVENECVVIRADMLVSALASLL